jgi:ribosomal protein S27E
MASRGMNWEKTNSHKLCRDRGVDDGSAPKELYKPKPSVEIAYAVTCPGCGHNGTVFVKPKKFSATTFLCSKCGERCRLSR